MFKQDTAIQYIVVSEQMSGLVVLAVEHAFVLIIAVLKGETMDNLHHFECESKNFNDIAKVSFRFSNVREFFHRRGNDQVTEVVMNDGMHVYIKMPYDEFLNLIIENRKKA